MIKPLMNNRQRSRVVFIVRGFSPSSSSDPLSHLRLSLFDNSTLHACLTLSFYAHVPANLGTIYLRSDRPRDGKCFSFPSLSVTVTFIHPLMRSTSSPTFDEDNGFHILDIRFSYDRIFTPLRPQFKQASPSTAFLLLLLPIRLLDKHTISIL